MSEVEAVAPQLDLAGDAGIQRLPLSSSVEDSPLGEAEFPLTIFSMWCVYHMAWYVRTFFLSFFSAARHPPIVLQSQDLQLCAIHRRLSFSHLRISRYWFFRFAFRRFQQFKKKLQDLNIPYDRFVPLFPLFCPCRNSIQS